MIFTAAARPRAIASPAFFVPNPYAGLWRRLDRFAARLAELRGWRALLSAIVLGAVSSLALPPAFLFPVLWITMPVLLWMLQGDDHPNPKRRAFLLGWGFGFGLYTASLYWISNALLVYSSDFWWAVPFAAIGLPAFLGLFTALTALAAGFCRSGPARVLGFAVAWCLAEYARGHILTGFPWNLLGHAWAGADTLIQPASAIGLYGLTALVTISACLPALAAGVGHMTRGSVLALAAALPLVAHMHGTLRLDTAPPLGIATAADTGLRLVQANIPQQEKWKRDRRVENFTLHLMLSEQDRPAWITHVIWPETAAAFYLADDDGALAAAAEIVPPEGYLLTGAPRVDRQTGDLYNSIVAIDSVGRVAAAYDKTHLVPFGEYSPLEGMLPAVAATGGSFSPGTGLATLSLPGLPSFSPLVCYEAIFPGAAVSDAGDRPQWLLNLTNDAWYGETAGPHQHATMARLRSVEEGLPLVRATNTGISIVFDSYGREIGRLPLNVKGVLDIRLPQPLAAPPPYARFGDSVFWVFILGLLGCTLALHRRPPHQ
ncbi:MAG: apolipoprotein N-acyltransferase [Alphaproteobacteria bacterium]